jgi:hypothetical protein
VPEQKYINKHRKLQAERGTAAKRQKDMSVSLNIENNNT